MPTQLELGFLPSSDKPLPASDSETALPSAVERHGKIVQAMRLSNQIGDAYTSEQRGELHSSRVALDALRSHGARDLETAMANNLALVDEAASGQTARAVRAMQLEAELRTDPQLRADRFIKQWNHHSQAAERAYVIADYGRRRSAQNAMRNMALSLERDPQMESILANRKKALGITIDTGQRLGAELAFHQGIDLGRGRGIGIGT